ncbi:MAG TPA: FecR domain-containing protein, partial [Planctomycetota bacterium]|nr:FecR domain-containing protein [Planctomycetota bacterium]
MAGLLLVVIVLMMVFSSGGDSKPAPKSPRRESMAQRQEERDRRERVRAQAEREEREREQASAGAEKKRLEAEAQLREIEEKRRILTQAKPEAGEQPQARERRDKDLEALKREQERIEQALRDAIERAKKSVQPAPAVPPQEQTPSSPQATPLVQPEGATQAAIAQVEEVSGEVFLVTQEGKTPLARGANVFGGQGLQTGGNASRILLRFSDKTQVDLGPETVLAELKTESGKRLALTQGTLRAVVAKQPKDQPMVIATPQGPAKVIGTTLRLVVDPDPKKGTRLDVEEGNVELKNLAGKTVYVESGHYAVAAVGVELVSMPAILFSDSFDRGNLALWRVPPGSDWTVIKSPSSPGFALTGGPGAIADRRGWGPLLCGNSSWQDYALEASIRFENQVGSAFLLARALDTENFYWFEYSNSPERARPVVYLFRRSKRENFLIKSGEAVLLEPNRWIRFRFELLRKSLKGFVDGNL